MRQKYLVPHIDGPTIELPATRLLRGKWVAARLDQTGRAYSGAFRIDFSPGCEPERALNAVADTLAKHSILAAHFEIVTDKLVGCVSIESVLKQALRQQLYRFHDGVTDEDFIAYSSNQMKGAELRLASAKDEEGLHVWIGFPTFTCDGTSIDLLIEGISCQYLKKSFGPSCNWIEYAQAEIVRSSKRSISIQDCLEIYPKPGPYGLDAIRHTPYSHKGKTQSVSFDTSVLRKIVMVYAKTCRVTPFVLLFAMFQRAVSAVSGVKTIVTGVPFVNRYTAYDYKVVGPLSNTVVITTCHVSRNESLPDLLGRLQKSMIKATGRQGIEASAFYPKGVSSRNVDYELPFPQLFNAWNARLDGARLSLGESNWMTVHLLPNNTCRAGFEVSLDSQTETISGRIDMDADAYGNKAQELIDVMKQDLEDIRLN